FAHANSTQSCRSREALLSSGLLCRKNGTLSSLRGDGNIRFFGMKWRRLGSALGGVAVSAAVLAALWPHAREAGALLSAQDDLAVFGDIRDVVREGKHLAMGEDTDRLVLGLATAGLAVTAATYISVGGMAPVRAGLTLVKDARKVGRLGEGLAEWTGRSVRQMVDTPVLQNA